VKQISILDSNYSTTKLCYKFLSDNYLDESGKIKENLKFSVTIPELNIINSKISKKENEEIDTYIFFPEGENRRGEGGLRTKGYIKFSYKYENGKWWAIDFRGNKLFEVNLPKKVLKDIERKKIRELPLVTIVTVVLNNKEGLEKTIKSVINQTYPNVEHIVIDGGSTDGTLDIIKKYENCIDYWVSEKDKGIYDAMNKGIDVASGKWINFMNAGDKFHNDSVLMKINLSDSYDLIYGKVILISNDAYNGKVIGRKVKKDDFFFKMPICHQAIFHKKDAFEKIGKYNTSYKISADHEWILRLLSNNCSMKFYDLIVAEYLMDGFSENKLLLSKREKFLISKIYFSNSNLKASYLYIMSVFKSIGVKLLKKLGLLKYYRFLKS